MEIGIVRKIDIDQEMQQAYLDYAMSVIVSRALPDARDGLKPVHRRILFAMYDMGLRPNSSYKKSARVVGEVLGKYHPHSDQAVYDAMARMAQDFSMRYPMVDGQGNFGSMDGDPPAAMRYTEARLTSPSMDIMEDIQKNTVDFTPNFDDSLDEPTVLPASLPNMLINGATGIAVGMATNIPPHNLNEVVDALHYVLEKWTKRDDISVEELMQFVKGPDFPTGGIILSGEEGEGLASAYGTGRGRITVQARAHIEDMGRNRERLIITELPYMTNKASLIERIAKLARAGTLEGLSDLRDESDRQGMRIVIELSKNADSQKVLAQLYKRTSMQGTFGIIMLALVGGEPKMLSLKQSLLVYIEHRLDIIRRRSEYDLERARHRSHILEGLRVALKNLDEVITLIRKSPDVETARTRLIKRYKLSEIQANSILDMPLRRLAALERKKIETEYKEVQKLIKSLESLLSSPKKMRNTVGEELTMVKENYGDRRRTQIVKTSKDSQKGLVLTASDLTPDSAAWVVVDKNGLISRTLEGKSPRLSGKAAPKLVLKANTRDIIYLVATDGTTAAMAVHALPEAPNLDGGTPVSKVCALSDKHELGAIFSIPAVKERGAGWNVVAASKGGMVKKSALQDLPGPSSQTFSLMKVKIGDEVIGVGVSTGKDEFLFSTANGMTIRFSEDEVRPTGMLTAGVNGIKLKGEDQVIGFKVLDKNREIFFLATDGNAKLVKASQFPVQGRYGQGVQAWKLAPEVKLIGMANDKPNLKVVVHLARAAAKAIRLDDAPTRTRQGNGKALIEIKETDRITGFSLPWEAPSTISMTAKPRLANDDQIEETRVEQIAMDLKGADKKKKAPAKKKSTSRKAQPKKKKAAPKKKAPPNKKK
ncbi:MAG: DNA gyrase subunit A [Chloroflexota bacterium]